MGDSFTEVAYEGWGSRLRGSFGGAIAGILMFLASFPLLWWNEGRAVDRYRDLAEGRGACVSIQPSTVSRDHEGKLVHVSGTAETEAVLRDIDFAVSAKALRLRRSVEMYQWDEDSETRTRKTLGGGKKRVTTYTYEKKWSSSLIDSSHFKKSEGHQNPGALPVSSQRWNADTVTLGKFTLNASQVSQIDAWTPVEATQAQAAAATLPGDRTAQLHDGGLYVGADPGTPQVGDVRIRFAQVPATTVSLIARQTGSTFAPWTTSGGRELAELTVGTKSADAMFSAAESANALLTWILRLVGFVVMLIGLCLIASPLTTFLDVIPFLGSLAGLGVFLFALVGAIACSVLTIALAWLFYRPLVSIPLLAVAGALIWWGATRGAKRKAATA